MEKDEFLNVKYVGMESVGLIFDSWPLFSELVGSACDELQWNSNEDAISVEGVIHYSNSGRFYSWQVRIAYEVGWKRYVNTVMKISSISTLTY